MPELQGEVVVSHPDRPGPAAESGLAAGRALAGAGGVALVAAIYAAALLALKPGYPASADNHYHFSVGREIAHGTWVPDVARGLPLTVLREMPVDHYWGYHVLLAPFGLASDPQFGMDAATVVLFAGVCVAVYLFLRARRVSYAWAWALAPMLLSTQDWRFMQLRGGQLIVPLLFAMTQTFFEPRLVRRSVVLLFVGYVAMLSYHGGIVLLPFHLGGMAALAALRPSECRGRLLDPLVTAAGLALGLTVNPYMDARASTWRFAALHIGEMGRDAAHLYDDQEIAEFHGFPASVLTSHPEWLLFLCAVLLAVASVAWRARREATPVGTDAIVLSGMALTGIALTAQAMRTREYSVPVAFSLLAVLAPRRPPTWTGTGLTSALLGLTFVSHGRATLALLPTHLPTRQYEGARRLLEANGDRPILNVAEADYAMLRFQYGLVVCVQGLSRYFIYPYKDLFHDVWEIHDHADTSAEIPAILRRFWDRGVRLVAVHRTHRMMRFADAHPRMLRLVFRSEINGASIYAIDRAGLEDEGAK
ncbi:MAG TPA: hypothetical protein VEK07_19180 [Polyangiaceae bacterium]|nr:hypothetical protein [Polyangiaceae bacterium]